MFGAEFDMPYSRRKAKGQNRSHLRSTHTDRVRRELIEPNRGVGRVEFRLTRKNLKAGTSSSWE